MIQQHTFESDRGIDTFNNLSHLFDRLLLEIDEAKESHEAGDDDNLALELADINKLPRSKLRGINAT